MLMLSDEEMALVASSGIHFIRGGQVHVFDCVELASKHCALEEEVPSGALALE